MVKKNLLLFQIIYWLIIALSNMVLQYFYQIPYKLILTNGLSIGLSGLIITSIYLLILSRFNWINWSKIRLVILMISSVIFLTFFSLCITNLVFYIKLNKILPLNVMFNNIIPIGVILLLWLLIYFSFTLMIKYHKSEVDKWKLQAEYEKAKLDIIKLQVNPHFLFNTLNNIRALIRVDKDKAREMLTHFSDLFRYSLKSTSQKEVELEQELDMVKQYLELCKIQFDNKLHYIINCTNIHDMIPPMVIQIMVENAIKHGVALSTNIRETIQVDISKINNHLTILVENSRSKQMISTLEESSKIGIKNIKERLKHLYGNQASFELVLNDDCAKSIIKIIK